MDILQNILNKRVKGVSHNYIEKSLIIYFNEEISVEFYECAIVFDLGIVGHTITYAAFTGPLGMTFELKRLKQDPDDYNCMILSRDINDYENKNEIIISFKSLHLKGPQI